MIEELKVLVDLLGNVAELGIWVLAGFVFYKAVIYLSTAGIIYHLVKMFIVKLHDIVTKKIEKGPQPKPTPEPQKIIHTYSISKICISDEGTYVKLKGLIMSLINPNLSYIHASDVNWLEDAIMEKKTKDAEIEKAEKEKNKPPTSE